jgi:hypothetical protein
MALPPEALPVRLLAIDLFERPVRLRLPFRFGVATLTQASQAFVRVRVQVKGRTVEGGTAEMLLPKWFDKAPELTPEQNAEQLRCALRTAREAYLAQTGEQSAWSLSRDAGDAAAAQLVALGLPRLAARFGPAQIDKAVADAVLRAAGVGWVEGAGAGLLGDPWWRRIRWVRAGSVAVRHTVGLLDVLRAPAAAPDAGDGLPATLEQAVRQQGLGYLKIKLSGDGGADLDRLAEIEAVMAATGAAPWFATLDGNENFGSLEHLARFWSAARSHPRVRRLLQRTLLLEQPLPRSTALDGPIASAGIDVPVIIDESDDHQEAFAQALALGYRGVSSKSCKGLFHSLRKAVAVLEQPGLLLTGEDLLCQAGLAVQQDTLLASSLGIQHVERNGHHYVAGFAAAPAAEARAFAAAHADFYASDGGLVRVRIGQGRLRLETLHAAGFGSKVHPTWELLSPMAA